MAMALAGAATCSKEEPDQAIQALIYYPYIDIHTYIHTYIHTLQTKEYRPFIQYYNRTFKNHLTIYSDIGLCF